MRALFTRPALLISVLLVTNIRAGAAQNNTPQALPAIGTSGGTPFSRACPAGQVLTGVRARMGLVIDALGIKCRAVAANGSLGGENDFGSLAGGSGGTFSSGSCPQNTVVMGQGGSPMAPAGVGSLFLQCRRWDAATRQWTGDPVTTIRLIAGAGAVPSIIVSLYQLPIPAATNCARRTQPATILRGRSGAIIDAAALTCNEP